MQVTVIIVNYKTKELTTKAIQSVFDKTEGIEYEITVVDNASNDGSVEYLEKQFGNEINLIKSKENLGFGRANNEAIRQSKAKYIFLLNSDTELINNAIKIFYDFMENTENLNIGVCGGNLYNINNKPSISYNINKASVISFIYSKILELLLKPLALITKKKLYCNFNYSNKIKEVGSISGADMFIRNSALQKTGLFDESIFMYSEDVDLNFRIKKAGYKIISVPFAKIMHIEHGSFNNTDNEKYLKNYKTAQQGNYRFLYKTFGKKTYIIYLSDQIINSIKYIFCLVTPKFILKKIVLNLKSNYIYKQMIKITKEEYIKLINQNL